MIDIEPDNRLTFTISENQDSSDPFFKAFEIINEKLKPLESEHGGGFFDEAKGYFIEDGITVCLEYTSWFGTELFLDKKLPESDVEKVKQWVEIIRSVIKL